MVGCEERYTIGKTRQTTTRNRKPKYNIISEEHGLIKFAVNNGEQSKRKTFDNTPAQDKSVVEKEGYGQVQT